MPSAPRRLRHVRAAAWVVPRDPRHVVAGFHHGAWAADVVGAGVRAHQHREFLRLHLGPPVLPQTTTDRLASVTDTSEAPVADTPRTRWVARGGSSASTTAAASTAGLPRSAATAGTMSKGKSGRPARDVTDAHPEPVHQRVPTRRAHREHRGPRRHGDHHGGWPVLADPAYCTCLSCSTWRAMAPVSTRMSGTPCGTCAAASTCAAGTARPPPATWTERTTRSREPSRAHASAARSPYRGPRTAAPSNWAACPATSRAAGPAAPRRRRARPASFPPRCPAPVPLTGAAAGRAES